MTTATRLFIDINKIVWDYWTGGKNFSELEQTLPRTAHFSLDIEADIAETLTIDQLDDLVFGKLAATEDKYRHLDPSLNIQTVEYNYSWIA